MAYNSSRYPQPKKAHEISIRARETEKRQMLMVAEMRGEEKLARESKGFLYSLLTSLRIF
jgi:hypothetical protein